MVTECRQRGSATVLMLGVLMLAGFLITATLMLASAIVARHRAGSIADLSALAAADATPGTDGCERARRVAAASAGHLTGCRILADGSVRVDVALAAGGHLGLARGSARAGPALGL